MSDFFEGKICECEVPRYRDGGPWPFPSDFKVPPVCGRCRKWFNNLHVCCKCHERYYQFFQHSRMGYHIKPLKGWYCWSCLEKWLPPAVSSMYKELKKTPPPPEVLTPAQAAKLLAQPQRVNAFADLI